MDLQTSLRESTNQSLIEGYQSQCVQREAKYEKLRQEIREIVKGFRAGFREAMTTRADEGGNTFFVPFYDQHNVWHGQHEELSFNFSGDKLSHSYARERGTLRKDSYIVVFDDDWISAGMEKREIALYRTAFHFIKQQIVVYEGYGNISVPRNLNFKGNKVCMRFLMFSR